MSPAALHVLESLGGNDVASFKAAVQSLQNIDERLDDGESLLFHAVLSGRVEFVEILIVSGADPNFLATDPAEYSLAPTPLELAWQARFLMDWEMYQPIAILLQHHGARDREGGTDNPEQLEAIEDRARTWQTGLGSWSRRALKRFLSVINRLRALVVPKSWKASR